MRNLVSFFAVALTLFLTFSTNSLFAKEWKMNEESSSVRFIYSLEGAAFRGRFRNFSADINFDPSNPEDGSINGVVSIESSRSSSAEHDEYLMEEDWFNPKEFPESTSHCCFLFSFFSSSSFCFSSVLFFSSSFSASSF